MKQIPAALQAHYDSGGTSLASAIVIKRTDGKVFAFTSHDQPLVLDVRAWGTDNAALVFDCKQGLSASGITATSGFAVDNLELTTLDDGSLFVREEVAAGLWQNAEFRLFRYRWDVAAPTITNDVEPLMRGWLGEITLGAATLTVELRGLKQKLQQSLGMVSQKTCRSRLGATGLAQCNRSLVDLTHAVTVIAVTDKRTFTVSGGLPEDYLGEGLLTWKTGANAGLTQKVRSQSAAGVVTLVLPMVLPIAVGDQLTAVAGCRKRLTEDCSGKFGNAINFQGEPHRPSPDVITRPV
ncbi:DUF2163 domain-containing protein [Comamonas sp. E6]|uniref:DUF2163 domain-containing protein n=1 Tax=Comamonas sp. E6 TaxID=364029 RepID=UPI00062F5EB9|nr:DUF2163 domain-containing protein [Comamonas sp. E6]GAO71777.1 hypothetical protein CSE6_017_32140 [Comamonas sp. E6]